MLKFLPDFILSAKCAGHCEMVETSMANAALSWCGALQSSLRRLGQSSVGLYQIHWPGFPVINNWATEAFVEGLANVQQAGLAKVGNCIHMLAINNACLCAACCPFLSVICCLFSLLEFVDMEVQASAQYCSLVPHN